MPLLPLLQVGPTRQPSSSSFQPPHLAGAACLSRHECASGLPPPPSAPLATAPATSAAAPLRLHALVSARHSPTSPNRPWLHPRSPRRSPSVVAMSWKEELEDLVDKARPSTAAAMNRSAAASSSADTSASMCGRRRSFFPPSASAAPPPWHNATWRWYASAEPGGRKRKRMKKAISFYFFFFSSDEQPPWPTSFFLSLLHSRGIRTLAWRRRWWAPPAPPRDPHQH